MKKYLPDLTVERGGDLSKKVGFVLSFEGNSNYSVIQEKGKRKEQGGTQN